jgi:hypothetical protein
MMFIIVFFSYVLIQIVSVFSDRPSKHPHPSDKQFLQVLRDISI